MYKKTNIKSVVQALLLGETCCEQTTEGFIIAYKFSISSLSELELKLLNLCMTGNVHDGMFYHWMADVEEKTIIFDSKEHAYETLKQQMPNFEKRLTFSAFQETGIVFERESTGNVQFFNKRG